MVSEQQLDQYAVSDAASRAFLKSRAHPIVLLPTRQSQSLSRHIAPGLNEIGVMLPYSPLHHLLLEAVAGPLVATSANLSGEPVLTRNTDVTRRLAHVADACLHHNRDITRPADDPLYRFIANKPRPLRLGRGNAPLELELPFTLPTPVLATGGHMKNTVALAWHNRIVISPHVGDLHTPRSQHVFEQVITDLQQLYRVTAERVICDTHPGYASSRWAQRCGLAVQPVLHHHAHAAVLCGEYPHEPRWLVFTWDGVGLGTDNGLWGGEALLGKPGHWQRVASMRQFRLPGADKAARQPWRSAAALCWEAGLDWQVPDENGELLHAAWRKQVNAPPSSAVGRLFDAAASLLGLVQEASFEGQGPMLLEACAGTATTRPLALPLQQDAEGTWRSDWQPLLHMLLDNSMTPAERARCFHESLGSALLQQAQQLRAQHGDFAVGLCGGVFQNRLLTEVVMQQLQQAGFRVYLSEQLPVNDAGLCYGQVIEAMHANT
jgi:hydrogenase maturation protein HypF